MVSTTESVFEAGVVCAPPPHWIEGIYWNPASKKEGAIAEFKSGQKIRIRTFETPSEERRFKQFNAADDLVTVVIRPKDRPCDVRSKVLAELGRKRKK